MLERHYNSHVDLPALHAIKINLLALSHWRLRSYATACAVMYWANATGFLVCMKTLPGPSTTLASQQSHLLPRILPVNLQTKPSPAPILLRIPPLATRSRT